MAGGGRGIYDGHCWVWQGMWWLVVAEGFMMIITGCGRACGSREIYDYYCWVWQGMWWLVVAEGFMILIAGCDRARRLMWWL